jgi:hypothetical protein
MNIRPALAQLIKARTLKDEAEAFASWLEHDGELEDLFRYVVKLASRPAKVPPPFTTQEMGWMLKAADKYDPRSSRYAYEKEIDRIIAKIQKKHSSRLKIVGWNSDATPIFERVPIPPVRRDSLAVCAVMDSFQRLARTGILGEIKWCNRDDCNTAFFAFRRDRRYCCDECQRIAYGRSTERKKHNLQYQKTYYHEWLSAEAKRMQTLAARLGLPGNRRLSDLKEALTRRG